VTGIAAGPSGEVWIATHGGLARYAPGAPGRPGDASWTTATVESDGLPYPTVLGLAVDRRGVAWAATGAGAAMVDRRPATGARWASRAFTNVNAPLLHQILDAVYVDPEGRVWFGGAGGVNVYRPETADSPSDWLTGFNQESTRGALPDNQVYTIVGDGQGRVWLGTPRGAAVFTPDAAAFGMGAFDAWRWQTFDRPPDAPLAGDAVYAIVEDRQGRLYFGTRRGVTVLDEAQSDPAQRWRRLGAAEGQPGLPDPRVQALAFGPDGRLWAGTQGGLAVYDPARPQEGWRAYRANPGRRWAGYLWPQLWERNILDDDVTALAWG
jgi:ligand-binding sensor domain-containing protein